MKNFLFTEVALLIILILILFLCGLVWATLFSEPAVIFLFGSGLLGLAAFGRRKLGGMS